MKTSKNHAFITYFTRITLLSVAVAIAVATTSCSRRVESSLKLEANPLLTGGLGWAVVKNAYVRLKERPSDSSRDLDHLRRGAVFHLDEREFGLPDKGSTDSSPAPGDVGIWYGIESEGVKGWVRETELDIYASRAQADMAASAYR